MISPSLFRQRRFLLFVGGSAGSWAAVYVQGSVSAFLLLTMSGDHSLFGWTATIGSVAGWTDTGGDLLLLLLALPLGVLVDRVRRRSVLVAMSLLGAVLLASVPVAAWLGAATWPHVALVGMIIGMLQGTSIAHDAYLPAVVGRDRLLSANAVLTVVPAIVVLGVMLVTVYLTDGSESSVLLVMAVVLALSAFLFRGIDAPEEPPGPRAGLWRELAEGVRFTLTHPVLRAIALFLVLSPLFEEVVEEATSETVHAALLSDRIDLGWTTLAGSVASLAVVLPVVLLHRRVGVFRMAWLAALVTPPFALLSALADTAWGAVWYAIGTVVPQAGWTVIAVALLSHRQAITPDRLLGRTGGTLLLLTGLTGFADESLENFAELLLRGWGSPPVLALGMAGMLAAAIPLLKVRHLATSASPRATPDDKVIGSVGPDLET
ncbi:MFS transporter [Streptosporangium sp. 'caverna']|uniref:MFS transporter n=1 Tax=Streptosporangium sp. 'caverna' TaxID=2202249 RepID=UPI000D7E4271|nr:MFS transporter [Streptosporangium sp. 'caverna']AWS46949.1 hypothetical protein DKM19_42305 [Streptosporangium sp. 'caverna']